MGNSARTLQILEETLEVMVLENEKITARAVIARMDGVLKHPSDITRNAERGRLFNKYKDRQERVRALLKSRNGRSAQSLSTEIARLSAEVEVLRSERSLLIASHRVAILAVGELGGASAWLKFFKGYNSAVEHLQEIGAIPENETDINKKIDL
ncbi:hypothetical protein [Croceicoccus marinus]|uniref:Uncharacterized protein n=1 Tax=Croceicoccus marinus TaxID=450378 RepID=A0A1Z1FDC1_9SPHN|nr:hypothetical protein [Croceicoccus marinus]ARU16831.1 hypothetical protein A9D14_12425 [Croceicoccus marinus]